MMGSVAVATIQYRVMHKWEYDGAWIVLGVVWGCQVAGQRSLG